MPQMPPAIGPVKDDAAMRMFSDALQSGIYQTATFVETTSNWLEPRMLNSMKKYGLDGRYGFTAKRSVGNVTSLLMRAVGHLIDAGKCIGYAYMAFNKDVWVPIQIAKQQQKTGSTQMLDV